MAGVQVTKASHARARSVEEMRELGKKAAAVLRENGFQEEAARACGIHEKTYYRWLDDEDSEGCLAFQAEVVPALLDQAREALRKAESDIGCTEQGSSAWANWHKWKLGNRYRKLFGDLAQKHEVSGPEGKPLQVQAVPAQALSPVEMMQRVRELADAGDDEALALLEEAKKV